MLIDDDKKENKQKRKVYTTLTPKEEEILRKKFNEKIKEIEKKALKKKKDNLPGYDA